MIYINGDIKIPKSILIPKVKAFLMQNLTYTSPAYKGDDVNIFPDFREDDNYFYIPVCMEKWVRDNFSDYQVIDERNNIIHKQGESDLFQNVKCNIKLKENQEKLINLFFENVKKDKLTGGIIKSDVGSGKSMMLLYIAYRLRRKTLILVHRENLFLQFIDLIDNKKFLENVNIGFFKGQKKDVEGKDIVIGMMETAMLDYNKDLLKDFGLVLIDEVERIAAPVYINAIKNCNSVYRFGFSATPVRYDAGKFLLENNIGNVIVDGNELGLGGSPIKPHICIIGTEFKIYQNGREPKESSVFYSNKINNVMDRRVMIVKLSKFILQDSKRNILIMTDRVDLIDDLVKMFDDVKDSIKVVGISGEHKKKNKNLMEELDTARVIISNKQFISVGVSKNHLNTLIFASFVEGGLQQKVGRITRVDDGIERLVFDIVDNQSKISVKTMEKKKIEYKKDVQALGIYYNTWGKIYTYIQSKMNFDINLLVNSNAKID